MLLSLTTRCDIVTRPVRLYSCAVRSTHLFARSLFDSVATLEGIALVGDPQYQMVAQAYPFVVSHRHQMSCN